MKELIYLFKQYEHLCLNLHFSVSYMQFIQLAKQTAVNNMHKGCTW